MSLTSKRPTSLCDVAARALGGEAFDPLLREFLDEFYLGTAEARTQSISRVPGRLSPVKDAYLAAAAEHLALRFKLPVPDWVDEPERFLERPFFAGGLETLKAVLLVESPLAFRRRQIFVSANALSRPRDADASATEPRGP
jgi:hypothetical protein